MKLMNNQFMLRSTHFNNSRAKNKTKQNKTKTNKQTNKNKIKDKNNSWIRCNADNDGVN